MPHIIQRPIFSALVLLVAFSTFAGEESKDTKPAVTVPAAPAAPALSTQREAYSDPIAGYSITVPTGYRRLTEDETRDVFNGLSHFLKKEAGSRAPKRPPVWFIGSINPKTPNEHPPSFAIAFTENEEQIDPAQIPTYRDQLEEKRKRDGDKASSLTLSVVKVDGITSLQEEDEMISPINNERNRLIRVAVPGKGKWFDIVFNYNTDQNDEVRAALKEALDSFKVMVHPPENIENTKKWTRVLYFTVGGLIVGIVLSFLIERFRQFGAKKDDAAKA